MNHLKIGSTVILEEDREYIIAAMAKKNNHNYVYLVTLDEPYEVKFAKEILNGQDIDLEIVWDKREKEELLNLFQKELNNLKI